MGYEYFFQKFTRWLLLSMLISTVSIFQILIYFSKFFINTAPTNVHQHFKYHTYAKITLPPSHKHWLDNTLWDSHWFSSQITTNDLLFTKLYPPAYLLHPYLPNQYLLLWSFGGFSCPALLLCWLLDIVSNTLLALILLWMTLLLGPQPVGAVIQFIMWSWVCFNWFECLVDVNIKYENSWEIDCATVLWCTNEAW